MFNYRGKLKKHRWGSNPGPKNDRLRLNHGAMAAILDVSLVIFD